MLRLIQLRLLMALALTAVSSVAVAAQHALLVGVSGYPSLAPALQLRGPKNDVVLMRSLLTTRGVSDGNIRVLADGVTGAHGEPTRERILGEFKALAERAQRGDWVFVFMAGHGSQQPARDLGPHNPEADGLDEIFLPRDIGRWSGGTQSVENAIVDNELGVLIAAIRNKGAFVWAVFDTCHAGTLTRGMVDDEVRYRDAKPADLGIPAAALNVVVKGGAAHAALAATRSAFQSPLPTRAVHAARVAPGAGGLVAFYAAQSWERAPELPQPAHLPAHDPNKKPHGALTFALAEAIALNPAMSYRQAAEQILQRYRAALRSSPTPLFEGAAGSLDAPLFGVTPGAQVLQWKIEKSGNRLRLPAGLLHRLDEGAVFAVMMNPGDRDGAAMSHVRAEKVELLQSTLVPMARAGRPAISLAQWPDNTYARLLHGHHAAPLRVSLPAPPPAAAPAALHTAMTAMQQLARGPVEGLALTWLNARDAGEVRLALRDGQLWFLPASGDYAPHGAVKAISIDLAGKSEAQIRTLVADTLHSMARAVNLIKLAAMTASNAAAHGVQLQLNAQRAAQGLALNTGQVAALADGDKLTLAVANTSNGPVDINLLFVDSRYGITHLLSERFEAHGRRTLQIGTVNTQSTAGRESLLVIVSEAQPRMPQADFGFLAQATLPATRGANQGENLHAVLEAVAFEPERLRALGAPARVLSTAVLRLFSWDAVTK